MTREEAINWLKAISFVSDPHITEAIDMAIEALNEVQKHEETFEWCHDCKEYDTENYCCHRWSKVIRNTVEELKEEPPTIPCFTGEIAENVRVVVQCKDCVWSKEWNDNQIFCDRILMRLRETDFCSYGERREP